MTAVQDEVSPPVPDARGLMRAYWTPRRAVWTLVALGVALRAWVVAGGYFYWDDYIFQGRAWRLPFDWDYLMHAHDGHLMPGAFALQWPLTRLWPMDYLPLALVLVLGQVLVAALFARLALALWRDRWLAAIPVAIVTVTPLTLPTNTWWAAALNGIPMQLALTSMLLAGLRWWRTGSRLPLWGALVLWLILLTFSEKVLLVPWAVLALVPVLDVTRTPLAAWGRAIRRTWLVWATCGVLSAMYVAVYARAVGKQAALDGTANQVADLVARGVTATALPGMLGGPTSWQPVGFGSAIGQPPGWLVLVSTELVVVLVVFSALVSRRSRRLWLWAAAYLLGDLALVSVGRLNAFVDPVIVQGMRYTADAAVPLALAVGAALAAVGPRAREVVERAGRAGVPLLRASVVALLCMVVVMSAVSTSRYREVWQDNPSRVYVAGAAVSLARAADGPALVDQPVPVSVLYGLAYPYNQASWLLSPLSPRPEFRDPTTQLRVLDDLGRLRPGLVEGPAARPGPVPDCGWLVQGSADISLEAVIVPFSHTVRVGYLSTGDGTATLALGDGPAREFDVRKGLGEVVITLDGGGSVLRLRELSPGLTLCTDDVRVGRPVAVGAS